MKKTVFFDLETGGLTPGVHPIIQFAGIAVDEKFKVQEELEIKLQFDIGECTAEALAVNSFDPEVWEKESFSQISGMKVISAFLKRHATVKLISKRGSPYYVALMAGHNASNFDGPMLQAWYKKADEFLPGYFRVLCTSQLAQWHFYNHPNPPENMKLGTLCRYFGVHLSEQAAHDALADVRANVKLARVLLEGRTISEPV